MDTKGINTPARQAAINGLAVVGFISLVALGISLAVYSSRYVPTAINRLGAAAVSLSQIFTPGTEPILTVIPTASTTISFGSPTPTVTPRPTITPTPSPKKPVTTVPKATGQKTNNTYQMGTTTGTAILTGLPDFVVTIKAVGYLATSSAESFVATPTVPNGNRPAVTFTIKNIGTNATGMWRFSASIPTQSSYIYESQPQQSLNPSDSIDYTLGFDQANKGADQMISVSANFDHQVIETTLNNNNASTKITILGS